MLDSRLLSEAIASPVTDRMLGSMLTVKLLARITAHDRAAGIELFAHNPHAAEAAAIAEAAELTADEQRELVGDSPARTRDYNARAFTLIAEALMILDLPAEVVDTITGDMIALFAAALLAGDVRAAAAVDSGEQEG